MVKEKISKEFRLKNINETRNLLIEVINQRKLMSKNHKMVCTTLNYIEHFLILGSIIIECVSISAFSWYSNSDCKFCNRMKNLCNNCSN